MRYSWDAIATTASATIVSAFMPDVVGWSARWVARDSLVTAKHSAALN
jgi:hypothetical protein